MDELASLESRDASIEGEPHENTPAPIDSMSHVPADVMTLVANASSALKYPLSGSSLQVCCPVDSVKLVSCAMVLST